MKKIWVLNTSMMNGTVTMKVDSSCFLDKETAEEASEAVYKANEGNGSFDIWNDISEGVLYESRDEVPILNKSLNQ